MKRFGFINFLLASWVFLAPLAHAQTEIKDGSATIEGNVCDAQNRPLAGATISLKNQKSGRTLVAHSNSKGHYFFKSLPLGNYDLLARMPG
ncbi:MAG: carboxypeptidase-like regulatory domain-containing protein, partial [Candidatus Acidiferrales bacterium]